MATDEAKNRKHAMILALDRCKCQQCQHEKEKLLKRLLLDEGNIEDISKVVTVEPVNEIEFWREKAREYEWMYQEQKDVAKGYRKILDEWIEEKQMTCNKCKENIRTIGENMV